MHVDHEGAVNVDHSNSNNLSDIEMHNNNNENEYNNNDNASHEREDSSNDFDNEEGEFSSNDGDFWQNNPELKKYAPPHFPCMPGDTQFTTTNSCNQIK